MPNTIRIYKSVSEESDPQAPAGSVDPGIQEALVWIRDEIFDGLGSEEGQEIVSAPGAQTPSASPGEGLDTLPMIGAAMRVRLAQCGIRTVADLANAKPEQLRKSLGALAALADIDGWVSAAQAHLTV